MNLNLFLSKNSLLTVMLGFSLTAQGVENNVNVKHLANEQNIVVLDTVKKFLLLPVQENAPEGKVNIIVKISPFLFIFHHFTYIRKSLYYSVF